MMNTFMLLYFVVLWIKKTFYSLPKLYFIIDYRCLIGITKYAFNVVRGSREKMQIIQFYDLDALAYKNQGCGVGRLRSDSDSDS